MEQQTILIAFEETSAAQANRYAEDLRDALLDAHLQAQRLRHDSSAQDAGQILHVILESTDIGALIAVLGKWLLRKKATLKFMRPEGEVIASNINDKTLIQLAELLLKASQEQAGEKGEK